MHVQKQQLISAGDLTGDVVGSAVKIDQMEDLSFHFILTGAGAISGTLKVQVSNKPDADESVAEDWVDHATTVAVSTSPGSALIAIPDAAFLWARPAYARTSGGTGDTLDCHYTGKAP